MNYSSQEKRDIPLWWQCMGVEFSAGGSIPMLRAIGLVAQRMGWGTHLNS